VRRTRLQLEICRESLVERERLAMERLRDAAVAPAAREEAAGLAARGGGDLAPLDDRGRDAARAEGHSIQANVGVEFIGVSWS